MTWDPSISAFRCATDPNTVVDVPLSVVAARIRSNEFAPACAEIRRIFAAAGGGTAGKEAIRELKKALPGVTFAGTFLRRGNMAWTLPSNCVGIDLDDLAPDRLETAWQQLIAAPCVALLYRSPSGSGLKGAVRVPSLGGLDLRRYAAAWEAVSLWLASLGLDNDPAVKDVARLAFLAHDPQAHLNLVAEPFDMARWMPPAPIDPQPVKSIDEMRPGDDFNRRADLAALLTHHGWSLVRDGTNQHWCRPGKTVGTSATLKDGVFYVFSSNAAPFESNRAYSPFATYALLEHHGDFQAAATALRASGYGAPPVPTDDVDLSGLIRPTPSTLIFDLQTFAETPEREIAWLWPGVIPRGMPSLIGGKQGLGKSFVICDLAARVSSGQPMPDGTQQPPGKVLLLAREDDASSVLLPRLRAAKADLSRVSWSVFVNIATGSPLDLAAHVQLLVEATTTHAFDLIVVDTFAAFAPVGTDANAAQDVRLLLDALARLARATGAAVVVVAHLRKTGQGDGDPMDAIAGSAQMTAGVRVAALLDKGIKDGERWFRVVKSNLGKINEQGWTWRFHWPDPFTEGVAETPRIAWAQAGEEYQDHEPGHTEVAIDVDAIRAALMDVVAKGPRSQGSAFELVIAKLRTEQPKLRKADVELVMEALVEEGAIEAWDGPRGTKLIGQPGSQGESPEDKAFKIAQEQPDLTVRRLRELAGCKKDTAMLALRDVRNHNTSESS